MLRPYSPFTLGIRTIHQKYTQRSVMIPKQNHSSGTVCSLYLDSWSTVNHIAIATIIINEFRSKTEESEKTGSHWELNQGHLWLEPPVLCHWAMRAINPHNYKYCTGGIECLSSTPGTHSVCAVRTSMCHQNSVRGWPENYLHQVSAYTK